MDTDQEVNRTRHQMKVPGMGADCARSGGSAFHVIRLQAMSAVYEETDAAGAVSDFVAECV